MSDLFKIGDRVRRRGLLAEVFGDDVGVVIAVRHGRSNGAEFEVAFGSNRRRFHERQIALAVTAVQVKASHSSRLENRL